MDRKRLKADLKRYEGFSTKLYTDSEGHLTIGYGRNLEDKGIDEREAEIMLDNDIAEAHGYLIQNVSEFTFLNVVRQEVLVNMVFNLGINKFLGFKKMLAAIAGRDYEKAADEMLDSRWARQVGNRAEELAERMRRGKDSQHW
jgi:lysozyme